MSQLIKGNALSSGSQNSLLGRFGELKSANIHLWNNEQSLIVGDIAHTNSGDSFLTSEILCDSGDGNWVTVNSGLVKSLENDLVEVRISSSCQESVKLF